MNNPMNSQAQTGTRDVTYNLVSVLYHALQGAETCLMYVQDAEQNGDDEMADFFREVIIKNRHLADEAKRLLGGRL